MTLDKEFPFTIDGRSSLSNEKDDLYFLIICRLEVESVNVEETGESPLTLRSLRFLSCS